MRDPQDWKSGDDPATPAQESYLETLAEQADEEVPDGMTKAAASEKIDELRADVGLDDQDAESQTVQNTPITPNGNR
jgi:hypothetical protein